MTLTATAITDVQTWLLASPRTDDGGQSLLLDLVGALRAHGMPLWRCSLSLLTMHPEVVWRNLQWQDGAGDVKVIDRSYEVQRDAFYTTSPIAALHRGSPPIRVRLEGTDALPYPICADLRAQGATDYYVQALKFLNGQMSFVSWATRAPGGFDDATLHALDALLPHIARRVELESAYHATSALLEVYLGRNAARRVLAGAFRRGGGELIDAAIWFCDLRDFTALSDHAPPNEVVETLDAYFERVAGAVMQRGGEVLKFVGDAILAIFVDGTDAREACRRALRAAEDALASLDGLNEQRAAQHRSRLAIGVALHRGQVMYGNIGARERLDFTVISSAVNEACRLEALCKPLATPITMSEAFARTVEAEHVVDLGEHALKGVARPIRVFTLERYRAG